MNLRPFRIAIPDADIADLHARLDRTRWPDEINDDAWGWGTPLPWLQKLVHHWRHEYDWRAQEARLNALPQFMATIDGQDIHFIHIRGEGENPFPLLLIHGWPGSVVEFEKLAPLLTRGPNAFSLVIPSLPGFGFSARPTARGMTPVAIGRLFAKLMAGLGYTRYGAQGGDWGSIITTQLALVDPAHLAGIHLNMVVAGGPPGGDPGELTEAEQQGLADMARYFETDSGYMQIQATKPQTLGYGLEDSPAGLAAWIVEKFRSWSDCGGDVESVFTRDQLLTNIMCYWCTGTAHSSARLYYENRVGDGWVAGQRVEVPTGAAIYPREIIRPPRRWAEASYNITHWREQPRGGHFAAMEQPGLYVEDVRDFFRTVR